MPNKVRDLILAGWCTATALMQEGCSLPSNMRNGLDVPGREVKVQSTKFYENALKKIAELREAQTKFIESREKVWPHAEKAMPDSDNWGVLKRFKTLETAFLNGWEDRLREEITKIEQNPGYRPPRESRNKIKDLVEMVDRSIKRYHTQTFNAGQLFARLTEWKAREGSE